MVQQHGTAARDRLWSHPDLLPTPDDLDEPLDFVARQGLDDELTALAAGVDAANGSDASATEEPPDGAQPEDGEEGTGPAAR
jgi:hypothetical protein